MPRLALVLLLLAPAVLAAQSRAKNVILFLADAGGIPTWLGAHAVPPEFADADGYVERNGVRAFYEIYGHGEPTVLLLPTWTLVHSRVWKAQIAYFARLSGMPASEATAAATRIRHCSSAWN